mgnify:CR=1 FL=1
MPQKKLPGTMVEKLLRKWCLKRVQLLIFFADYLQQVLDVPVGIIVSSWGGTSIQAWMSREVLAPFKASDLRFLDDTTSIERPKYKPCMLYNAMIAPVEQYTIKGFLWYQGESNRKDRIYIAGYSRLLSRCCVRHGDKVNCRFIMFR